uniref:Uncharacterized protein n=1 Tax=Arundo donax TaxID=35708 RepID=A0A0A9FKX6_ARUDO
MQEPHPAKIPYPASPASKIPFCPLLIQDLFHATVSFKSGPLLFFDKSHKYQTKA